MVINLGETIKEFAKNYESNTNAVKKGVALYEKGLIEYMPYDDGIISFIAKVPDENSPVNHTVSIQLYKGSGTFIDGRCTCRPNRVNELLCKHIVAATLAIQKDMSVNVREITPAEYPSLEDFLYNALFLPPGAELPPRDIIYNPDVFIYIDGFGNKPGDCGVVGEVDGKLIGAAWTRIIPAYGHIDDDTPELATSVLPEFRGQGIGTLLMNRLFKLLREHGFKQTSLSVQKKNDAVRFYQRLGYEIIRENEEDYIMLKDLS